jgi:hypothetical protein
MRYIMSSTCKSTIGKESGDHTATGRATIQSEVISPVFFKRKKNT